VSVVQIGDTFYITFTKSLGGLDIPTLNAIITSPFGTGFVNVGITNGTVPIGFQIPTNTSSSQALPAARP